MALSLKSILARASQRAREEARCLASGLRGQIGRNSYRWQRTVNGLLLRSDFCSKGFRIDETLVDGIFAGVASVSGPAGETVAATNQG
jgi:hypothetical protein